MNHSLSAHVSLLVTAASLALVASTTACGNGTLFPASPTSLSTSASRFGGERFRPLDSDDNLPGPAPAPPPSTPQPAIPITIASRNGALSFSPNPADAGGQLVVFVNADTLVHRVSLNDGTIDTGDILPGAMSAPVQMPNEGTNYHCFLHPDMIGAVMSAGGGAPPVCTGPYCANSGDNDPPPPPYYDPYRH
jgi:plastocyanin